MIMAAPLLDKDVHVCVADENAVFLDLRRDRYVGLDAEQTNVLARLVQSDSPPSEAAEALVNHLLEEQLLTRDERSGKALRFTDAMPPTAALFSFEYDQPCQVKVRHVFSLFIAFAKIAISLRLRSLAATVVAAQYKEPKAPRGDEIANTDHVRTLVLIFRRVRPLFYRGRDNCLLDSLVLKTFLARYGIHPRLVFGVAMGPFGGHCWVQHRNLVLNDRLERVQKYTPIMTA
jgi:hypothetical protein